MATGLSNLGLEVDSVSTTDVPTGGADKVLLYASGSGAASKLYMKAGNDTQKLLGTDIESLPAMSGSGLAATDLFMVADQDKAEGNEVKLTVTQLGTYLAGGDGIQSSAGVLSVGVDDTGIEINSDALRLKDSGVVEAKIADNAVTLAKMAGLARGSIIHGDASGDPAALAKGAAGRFLQSDGTDISYVEMSGDATLAAGGAVTLASAQTNVDSLKSDSLVVGRASGNDHIDFATAGSVKLMTDNTARVTVADASTTVSNNLIVAGDLTVQGSSVEVQQGFIVTASIQFEGSTPDDYELTLTTANPTADRTVTIPDLSGHVPLLAGAISTANVTAAEFALLDGASSVGTTALASGDGFLHNDAGTMKHTSIDKIADFFAGDALVASSGVLAVNVDDTGIEINSDAIRLKDSGVATAKIADDAVTAAKIATAVAGDGLAGGGGSALSVNVNSTSFQISSDEIQLKSTAGGTGLTLSSHALNVDAAQPQISTVGVLNSGSITSGFGAIDVGTSNVSGGTLSGSVAVQGGAASFATIAASGDCDFNGAADIAGDLTLNGGDGALTFAGANASIKVPDNSAAALVIEEANNAYMTFVTTNSSEAVQLGVKLSLGAALEQSTGLAAHFGGGFSNGGVSIGELGSGLSINAADGLKIGDDNAGADAFFYGGAANELLKWDNADNRWEATDSNGDMIYTLGGDATGEYALDVTQGSNNINKIRASAFVTYSDRTLKKDIAPLEGSLEKVMKLDAVSYKMKAGNRDEIGFIAQDVAKVVPEVCALDANGEGRGIDYSRMSALLAGAVKSQQLQIEELKGIISKLQK